MCAKHFPGSHRSFEHFQALNDAPIKFVPARDFNGSLQHPHALEQGRTHKCDGIRVNNVANRQKKCTKLPPRSPPSSVHIRILTKAPDRISPWMRVQRISRLLCACERSRDPKCGVINEKKWGLLKKKVGEQPPRTHTSKQKSFDLI